MDTESGEIIEGEPIPAGNGADWSRLWVVASEQELDKAAVHAYFGAGPEDGDLKAYAEQRAKDEGLPLQQIVEDMADELQHRSNDPAPVTDEEREAERQSEEEAE